MMTPRATAGRRMMTKRTTRFKFAFACLLAASGGNATAEQRSMVVYSLPGGMNVTSARGFAASSEWEMISDSQFGTVEQTLSHDNDGENKVREHWVQLAPPAELSAPSPVATGTIEVVVPIITEESNETGTEPPYPMERNIRGISLDITAPAGSMPSSPAALRYESDPMASGFEPRPWQDEVYLWDSPIFCHRPLYFEERSLERHGLVRFPMIRPAISGAHFFASVATLPYQAAIRPPCQCVASSHPSSLRSRHPATPRHREFKATIAQTATVAGLILLIP